MADLYLLQWFGTERAIPYIYSNIYIYTYTQTRELYMCAYITYIYECVYIYMKVSVYIHTYTLVSSYQQ